ncbi:dual specificity protein phosphatase 23 [Ictalurus punctatus]|uniref:Dual specificity protein phosphatase 23 n=1 Tax=Ictalurus punctatus TaxID=7998 RepID=A0A2D0PXM8_ICTPU|nr:dual specificity protein phosphatase 23 [Ictalurus punctatus]XP_017311254.1 dual specificity protein phosphatase 23 [Ictalurus punctatus]
MENPSGTPPNFSWVDVNKVAGLAWPSSPAHYRFLLEKGIKHLVCLCESKPPAYESCPDLKLHHIAMVDFTAPSLSQIQTFISVTEHANAGQAVAVHCKHGLGRTGTMLACYLLKTRKMSGAEAIKTIRALRPGSIETREQERAVLEFQKYLQESCETTVLK